MDLTFLDKMALSTFTSKEKQSLYQLLCGAMIVDGNRDSREIAVIKEVNQIMNITDADIVASRKLTEPDMVSCLRSMDTLKKAYAAKFMAQVILADGAVSQKEHLFFLYMKERLDIPDID